MRFAKRLIGISLLLATTACGPSGYRGGTAKSLRNGRTVEIAYPNRDTLSLQNILLLIRTADAYASDRLRFRIALTSPDSLTWCDTLEVPVEREKLPLYGISETERPIIADARFSREGVYIFSIEPLTGTDTESILQLGIIAEKSTNGEK